MIIKFPLHQMSNRHLVQTRSIHKAWIKVHQKRANLKAISDRIQFGSDPVPNEAKLWLYALAISSTRAHNMNKRLPLPEGKN
jgi:hypothetical protein